MPRLKFSFATAFVQNNKKCLLIKYQRRIECHLENRRLLMDRMVLILGSHVTSFIRVRINYIVIETS